MGHLANNSLICLKIWLQLQKYMNIFKLLDQFLRFSNNFKPNQINQESHNSLFYLPEVESSRTHFEVLGLGLEGQVLGLGLEASSPRKLACPRLEDSSIFWIVKILWSAWKIFWKTFFCGDRLKNFCEDLFFFGDCLKNFCEDLFFFWRALELVSLVLGLGLEHSCPWPRECLSSERLSLALALASDFFCVLGLGLEPCVLDSTSAIYCILCSFLPILTSLVLKI